MLRRRPATGEVHRSEVDGVPVFWTPQASRFTGALLFRVGRADESIPNSGLTHLVEHLALSQFDALVRYEHNGFVDGLRTQFHATGEPGEVAAFLRAVCEHLSSLPIPRVEHEARVLRSEASGRSSGVSEDMLWLRYGARGWGMVYLPEFALTRPEPERISAWGAEHFTAGNAAVWLSGPIPKGLKLPLREGPRCAPPSAIPIADMHLPAWLHGPSGGVGVSFASPRSDWFGPVLAMVQRRLQQTLRHEHGLSYGVTSGGLPLNAGVVHSVLIATAIEDHAAEITSAISETLVTVGRDGLTVEELEAMTDGWDRGERDPDSIVRWLDSAAANELVGFPTRGRDELRDELAGMTAASTAEIMANATSTAILRVPPGIDASGKWLSPYPIWSQGFVEGRMYRSRAHPHLWSHPAPFIRFGDEGISLVTVASQAITVRWDACAGLVALEDGRHVLYGLDGFTLALDASEWSHGERLIRDVRNRVPPELTVDLAGPDWLWQANRRQILRRR